MKRCAMTRLLTLLIAACLVLSLFGCTPKTDESQSASEPSSVTQTPEDSNDDTDKEPAAASESQPAAEEEKTEPTEEDKQAMTEQVEEQLEVIQEQAAQLEENSEVEGNAEAQEALNKAADQLDAYLQEEVEGSGN